MITKDIILEIKDIIDNYYEMVDAYNEFDSMECANEIIELLEGHKLLKYE